MGQILTDHEAYMCYLGGTLLADGSCGRKVSGLGRASYVLRS